ncbi:MAG: methyltransferase [Parcubacteria group bacterium Gr01-1014_106]|nr:MAG: methyltransferase [Parcubacteria group bacterium Gr01-1014_106]
MLTSVLSLGEQHVSNFVDAPTKSAQAPLDLVLCNPRNGGCGLLQLRHTVEAGVLYRNYWYRSGVNETMRRALADITDKVEQLVPLASGDVVVDIGSNDSTLLRHYRAPGLRRIGFEPAINLMPYAREESIDIINDFFSAKRFSDIAGTAKASVITSIAMFYDLEDPNIFVADAARCLAQSGVWVIQMSYLPLMLKQNAFDNICHEHLEYYALGSLNTLLSRHGLRVIDVELNDVNGGSFRVYVTHRNAAVQPFPGAADRMRELEEAEHAWALLDVETYHAFADRVETIKRRLVEFLKAETAKGSTVYVYGASTKGNTLLQYFNLDTSLIRAAAERNPDKWGKKTVGTLIPIMSEEDARAAEPAYFLVLPWHFLSEFVKRERAFLERGGKFIVPLPEFAVLGREVLDFQQQPATLQELLRAPAAVSPSGFSRGAGTSPT